MPLLIAFIRLLIKMAMSEELFARFLQDKLTSSVFKTPAIFNKMRAVGTSMIKMPEMDSGNFFEKKVKAFFTPHEIEKLHSLASNHDVMEHVDKFFKKNTPNAIKKIVGVANHDTLTTILNHRSDQNRGEALKQFDKVWFREGQTFGSSAVNALQFIATSEINATDTNQIRDALGVLNVVFIKQKKAGSYTYYNVHFSWFENMLARKGKNGSGAWSYFLSINPYFTLKKELSRDKAVMSTFNRQTNMTSVAKSRRGSQIGSVPRIKIVQQHLQAKQVKKVRKVAR